MLIPVAVKAYVASTLLVLDLIGTFVFALSGAVWLITAGLFARLFRRAFGFDDAHWPLFVFMAGSPFFLKNFMHTLGHFDIYGCLFAIVLLLIPARSRLYVLLATLWREAGDERVQQREP